MGSGGKVYRSDSADGLSRAVTGQSAWSDYVVEAKVKQSKWYAANSADGVVDYGFIVRYEDINNYYVLLYKGNTGKVCIEKKKAGNLSTLAEMTCSIKDGEWIDMKAVVSGSTLELYVNGEMAVGVKDADIQKGKAGLLVYYADVEYDDFAVSEIE